MFRDIGPKNRESIGRAHERLNGNRKLSLAGFDFWKYVRVDFGSFGEIIRVPLGLYRGE